MSSKHTSTSSTSSKATFVGGPPAAIANEAAPEPFAKRHAKKIIATASVALVGIVAAGVLVTQTDLIVSDSGNGDGQVDDFTNEDDLSSLRFYHTSSKTTVDQYNFRQIGRGYCRTPSGSKGTTKVLCESGYNIEECQNACMSSLRTCTGFEFGYGSGRCELHFTDIGYAKKKWNYVCYERNFYNNNNGNQWGNSNGWGYGGSNGLGWGGSHNNNNNNGYSNSWTWSTDGWTSAQGGWGANGYSGGWSGGLTNGNSAGNSLGWGLGGYGSSGWGGHFGGSYGYDWSNTVNSIWDGIISGSWGQHNGGNTWGYSTPACPSSFISAGVGRCKDVSSSCTQRRKLCSNCSLNKCQYECENKSWCRGISYKQSESRCYGMRNRVVGTWDNDNNYLCFSFNRDTCSNNGNSGGVQNCAVPSTFFMPLGNGKCTNNSGAAEVYGCVNCSEQTCQNNCARSAANGGQQCVGVSYNTQSRLCTMHVGAVSAPSYSYSDRNVRCSALDVFQYTSRCGGNIGSGVDTCNTYYPTPTSQCIASNGMTTVEACAGGLGCTRQECQSRCSYKTNSYSQPCTAYDYTNSYGSYQGQCRLYYGEQVTTSYAQNSQCVRRTPRYDIPGCNHQGGGNGGGAPNCQNPASFFNTRQGVCTGQLNGGQYQQPCNSNENCADTCSRMCANLGPFQTQNPLGSPCVGFTIANQQCIFHAGVITGTQNTIAGASCYNMNRALYESTCGNVGGGGNTQFCDNFMVLRPNGICTSNGDFPSIIPNIQNPQACANLCLSRPSNNRQCSGYTFGNNQCTLHYGTNLRINPSGSGNMYTCSKRIDRITDPTCSGSGNGNQGQCALIGQGQCTTQGSNTGNGYLNRNLLSGNINLNSCRQRCTGSCTGIEWQNNQCTLLSGGIVSSSNPSINPGLSCQTCTNGNCQIIGQGQCMSNNNGGNVGGYLNRNLLQGSFNEYECKQRCTGSCTGVEWLNGQCTLLSGGLITGSNPLVNNQLKCYSCSGYGGGNGGNSWTCQAPSQYFSPVGTGKCACNLVPTNGCFGPQCSLQTCQLQCAQMGTSCGGVSFSQQGVNGVCKLYSGLVTGVEQSYTQEHCFSFNSQAYNLQCGGGSGYYP